MDKSRSNISNLSPKFVTKIIVAGETAFQWVVFLRLITFIWGDFSKIILQYEIQGLANGIFNWSGVVKIRCASMQFVSWAETNLGVYFITCVDSIAKSILIWCRHRLVLSEARACHYARRGLKRGPLEILFLLWRNSKWWQGILSQWIINFIQLVISKGSKFLSYSAQGYKRTPLWWQETNLLEIWTV